MKKLIIVIALIIIGFKSEAQLTVSFTANDETQKLNICPRADILFKAETLLNGAEPADATYVWDFDDGTVLTSKTNTITRSYNQGGIYLPSVSVSADGQKVFSYLYVNTGSEPDYSSFKTDIPESQTGICLGETVTLEINPESNTTTYVTPEYVTEKVPQNIYQSSYYGILKIKNYEGKKISSAYDIKSVNVMIEHDNGNDLKITLTSPDGTELILKDYDTGNNYILGEPAKIGAGTPLLYSFVNDAQKTINEACKDVDTLEAGDYLPQESFDKLINCNINGEWTITVSCQNDGEGYLIKTGVIFNIIADPLTVSNQYNIRRSVWNGKGVSATTNGKCKVTPVEYDNTKYTYLISDDNSCWHDTVVYINVEKPSFEGAGDSTIYIGDEIEFKNKTSWASDCTWNFGDSIKSEGTEAPHAYYEISNYKAILTAISQSGCSDRDTQTVKVIARPLEIEKINIFTPDGNGINEIYTLFKKEDAFLSSGGLTGMPANIRDIKGKIYNIFGQTVCKWENIYQAIEGWDGSINNNGNRFCPAGTYYYDIIVYGKDGTSVKRSGTILLYKQK